MKLYHLQFVRGRAELAESSDQYLGTYSSEEKRQEAIEFFRQQSKKLGDSWASLYEEDAEHDWHGSYTTWESELDEHFYFNDAMKGEIEFMDREPNK